MTVVSIFAHSSAVTIDVCLPAAQNTVFQLSVAPPTPRLAHAARTYPREYPCCKIPDMRPLALTLFTRRGLVTAHQKKNWNWGDIRAVLEGHGNRVSIDTAHEKSKETSHSEELLEG